MTTEWWFWENHIGVSDDKQESGVDDIDALFGNVAIQGHGQNAKSDFDPFSQTVDFNAVPSQKPAAPTAPSMEDIFGIDENVADADVWGSLTWVQQGNSYMSTLYFYKFKVIKL